MELFEDIYIATNNLEKTINTMNPIYLEFTNNKIVNSMIINKTTFKCKKTTLYKKYKMS